MSTVMDQLDAAWALYESRAASPSHQSEEAAAAPAEADYRERHPLPDQPDGEPPDICDCCGEGNRAETERGEARAS